MRIVLIVLCMVVAVLALMVLLVEFHNYLWRRFNAQRRIIRVSHHGKMVAVRADLQGKHRSHCLCYGCERFYNSASPCPIAKATFDNCVKFGTVTPVWECPEYLEQRKP